MVLKPTSMIHVLQIRQWMGPIWHFYAPWMTWRCLTRINFISLYLQHTCGIFMEASNPVVVRFTTTLKWYWTTLRKVNFKCQWYHTWSIYVRSSQRSLGYKLLIHIQIICFKLDLRLKQDSYLNNKPRCLITLWHSYCYCLHDCEGTFKHLYIY